MSGERVRRRFEVRGVVQGVGFRPFVYVTAAALSLSGSVANDSAGVVIEVEGDPDALAQFAVRLREQAPPLAVVESVRTSDLPVVGGTGFSIAESRSRGGVRTLVSADVATCADCRRELADPADRRYRHPFISCTNCGPRFTIITGVPYDRPATTMAGFPMCPACEREYRDPGDRRFHAQPIACHDCGPRLSLIRPGRDALAGEQALAEARTPGGGPDPRGQGARRVPPGLRRRQSGRGGAVAPAKTAQPQAGRGDGARPGDRGRPGRTAGRGGRAVGRSARADRAAASPAARVPQSAL